MKGLSVRQPWTWALLFAGKDVENRSWRTDYRGDLLLHAGMQLDFNPRTDPDEAQAWRAIGCPLEALPFGAIVGVVTVVDCLPTLQCDSNWASNMPGMYGWVMENRRAFAEPIPWKGALGLFDVPDDVVRDALAGVGR